MAKRKISNYVFRPGISYNGNLYPNAYTSLLNNKLYIQKESIAYINQRIISDTAINLFPNAVRLFDQNRDFIQLETLLFIEAQRDLNAPGFESYTYNQDKCERDLGYVLDAIRHDLRYGGNWETRYVASFYWVNDVPQVDGNRQAEVKTYEFVEDLITNFIFTGNQFSSRQNPADSTYVVQETTGPYAEAAAVTKLESLTTIVYDVIENGLSVLPEIQLSSAPFANYTYNQDKCERDLGFVLDAYLTDLRYGGNEQIRRVASFYWEGDTAQIDGDRQPEIETHRWVADLIQDYILTNTAAPSLQLGVEQEIDEQLAFVSGTAEIIEAEVQILLDVINNGLDALPALVEAGYSRIKLQGRYTGEDLLLITNTTFNTVIYNFASNTAGGVVTFETESDPDFDTFLQTTDSITIIHLFADTTGQSADDDIQVFVEEKEIKTRPYDFGTDAIERMRIAPPLSMLDADFEYGLQPTKWQAIGIQRGYPSIYEIPGTEFIVSSMTTDASVPTDGVGASLITVNTISVHGLTVGTPVTVIGLEQGVQGSSRAEGSFVVIDTPTTRSFTYFAKGKVGLTAGEEISTSFTQIREGGFYTGAAIGDPTFSIVTQGTSGQVDSVFITPVGTSRIAFEGSAPSVGAPIQGPFIPSGAQVTGVVGNGGVVVTPNLVGNYSAGATQVTVDSVTSVVPNLGLDDGAGGLILVQNVAGNTITLSDPLQGPLVGNNQLYSNISGTNIVGTGTEASFNVTVGALSTYETVEIDSGGAGYEVGDTIRISGNQLGGSSPANDLFITVSAVAEDSTNNITSVTFRGEALSIPSQTIFALSDANYTTSGSGSGATFDITRGSTEYSVVLNDRGVDFAQGETITVLGTIFNNGATPDNDVTITVTEVTESYLSVPQTATSGTGTGALWDVIKVGASYTTVTPAVLGDSTLGDGYAAGDTITLAGTDLGASTPANDLTITVDVVFKTYDAVAQTSTSGSGTGATFNVSKSGTTYNSVILDVPGDGYAAGNTITLAGTDLGASSPANDLTVSVTQVSKNYVGISQDTTTGSGTGATFDVSKIGSTYNVNVLLGGSGYANGDTVRILGTSLDAATPANDLVMTVQTVDGAGAIQTVSFVGTAGGTGEVNQFTFSGTAGGTGFISSYSFSGTAGGTGGINDFTVSGVANGTVTYFTVLGNTVETQGSGAVFSVERSAGAYSSILVNFGAQGTLYSPGNRILVPGTDLGGTSPVNDLTIIVDTVGAAGEITGASADPNSVAISGSTFDLYSTILISENLTDDLPDGSQLLFEALATIEASFTNPHGIVPGGNFIVTINSDNGSNNHNLITGSYSAIFVPTKNTLRFPARSPGNITEDVPISGQIYARPDSFFVHRPYDGGVQLGTGGPQHGAQAIRQSKKYIRYQSGKGIMYTTGALFAPSYDILQMTADNIEVGSTITVELGDNDHGLQPGSTVRIIGSETSGYNDNYVVDDVLTERKFTVVSKKRLGSKQATLSPECQISTLGWTGAVVRAGIFDDQNGIFWEYDGQELAVVQRTATKQIAGTITLNPNESVIVGSGTRFLDQLKEGDAVVIKGMTHIVTDITSQTAMSVTPDFRGVETIRGAKVSLVQDKRVRQSNFNLDRLDGTGASGYNVDITKMQMIGIQYSWYGAGFIDFMLRGSDGNFVFAHRMRNSNINTEAFMRSGNLPVRYEVSNYGPVARLAQDMTSVQDTIVLEDAAGFPSSGVVYVDNEIITYSGKEGNTLTGCVRSADYSLFAQGADRVYRAGNAEAHNRRTGVISLAHTTTPLISHWGSAFITDGGFDEDRGYIFSYSETGITTSTTRRTAFLLRLAPSVSNAVVGDLGTRELLNRAQLLLNGIEITSEGMNGTTPITGGIIVEGILNPKNYPTDPGSVQWSELSGPAQGGQPSFAQVAGGGSIQWSAGGGSTTTTLTHAAKATVTATTTPYNNRFTNNSTFFYVTAASWNAALAAGVTTGTVVDTVTSGIRANTTVTGWAGPFVFDGVTSFRVDISQRTNGRLGDNATVTFSFGGDLTNRNFMYATEASFLASNAASGTPVSATTAGTFPAGTQINNIQGPFTFGSTTYYTVSFNNTYSGTMTAGSGTVTLLFEEPAFAQPGETVFSFIAVPGERSTLDLSELKELTNTTLGGRGTFPNGPDVLAINIYKTSGDATSSNIVLKWGEAQA